MKGLWFFKNFHMKDSSHFLIDSGSKTQLYFPRGLIGYSSYKRFSISRVENDELLLQLQSLEANHSVPLIEPDVFLDSYDIKLTPRDQNLLELSSMKDALIYCMVFLPEDVKACEVDLLNPIVVNKHTLRSGQFTLEESSYKMNVPLYERLSERFKRLKGLESNWTEDSP